MKQFGCEQQASPSTNGLNRFRSASWLVRNAAHMVVHTVPSVPMNNIVSVGDEKRRWKKVTTVEVLERPWM